MFKKKDRFYKEVFVDEVYKESKKYINNGIVLDVGALAGEYSFYIKDLAKQVYAVEPDPNAFKELACNIKEEATNNLKAFSLALSDHDGEEELWLNTRGGSTLLSGPWETSVKVKTQTLTSFLKDNKINHVDVMKIDIEGAEYRVFEDEAITKVDCIIGEHEGYQLLENKGFKIRKLENLIWIANKN